MTKDDIIRMAREAGFADSEGVVHAAYQLEAFANLVAAAEREACAKLCDSVHAKHIQTFGDYLGNNSYATECAAAIRARNKS
jgi:hypothetical protein